jgi:hypothetical protein
MSKYDPPEPPEYPSCPFCDGALEDKGILSFHDWVCVNPDCEHSINYEEVEMAFCAECNSRVEKSSLTQDPYPVPNWLVCPRCYTDSILAMGAEAEEK